MIATVAVSLIGAAIGAGAADLGGLDLIGPVGSGSESRSARAERVAGEQANYEKRSVASVDCVELVQPRNSFSCTIYGPSTGARADILRSLDPVIYRVNLADDGSVTIRSPSR